MNEEDINNWYEEKKEEILKSYFRKTDSLLLDEEAGHANPEKKDENSASSGKRTIEEVKALMQKYEKEFIDASTKLKKEYDENITKTRDKEYKKVLHLQTRKKLLKPFSWTFLQAKKIFFRTKESVSRKNRDIKNFYQLNFLAKAERSKQKFRLTMKGKLFPARLFFTQKIWPILHWLNTPNRILKLKLVKLKDNIKQLIKALIKRLTELWKKIQKLLGVIWKAILGIFSKLIGAITKVYKTALEFLKKLIEIIKVKYLPKKEEDK